MGPANTNEDSSANAQAPEMVLPLSTPMADVHAAWLAAGAQGDVTAMHQLRSRFPVWLDLDRLQCAHRNATRRKCPCVQRPAGQLTTGSPLLHVLTIELTCRTTCMMDGYMKSVGPSDSAQRPARLCSWDGFHLRTIGASGLHTAAWRGELAVVEFLLECGQDPDSGDNSGLTPAMAVILRLNLLVTRCVFRDGQAVRRNLVVDCRDELSEQLQLAVAVLTLLLRFGADVNVRSQDGKTALHCATSDDAYEVAKLLLDSGASVNAQDENGKTALHYCVHEGGLLVTNLMLAYGADINVEDSVDSTPLKHVLQRADLNVLQLFVNHHQLVATPQGQDFSVSVLFQAVDLEGVVRFIVDNEYASVTARNAAGETPLHQAIARRSPSVMEMLADLDPEGDSLTAVTTKMETPAHYAAHYGSVREVETLLLCLTRAFGDLEELVELGAANPLNTGDESGMTSLYVAGTATVSTESGEAGRSVEVRDAKVRLLLDHGGQLFPPGFLVRVLATSMSRSTHLVLPVQVQHCLGIWLVESVSGTRQLEEEESTPSGSAEPPIEALTELCMQWIACVACPGSAMTLVAVVTCASYAHEVLPLLISLPLCSAAFSSLLRWLRKFAAYNEPDHALLLQLHDELSEAWLEVGLPL
ncbi:hypothetical protein PR002_g19258 [Phytophthora rubi]|uniref:Uncharacterized protein n=1 Tax=Phytophthora rubi TaxID=129364 RepID=A0A6A3JW50_9STRA|nr:hypothetical protein PR002_g19258 [Phytophthora rubi]